MQAACQPEDKVKRKIYRSLITNGAFDCKGIKCIYVLLD